jgi:GxxExxY protein
MSLRHDYAESRRVESDHIEHLSAAIDIHKALGSGLFERAYLTCLTRELVDARLRIEVQKAIPLVYRDVRVDVAYRADLVVEECVLVEVKAIEVLAPIHDQQLRTYLRPGHYPVGLLLNFSAPTMKAGIKRIVNNFPEE